MAAERTTAARTVLRLRLALDLLVAERMSARTQLRSPALLGRWLGVLADVLVLRETEDWLRALHT